MIKEMAASVALTVGGTGTCGYSETAQYVLSQRLNSFNELRKPEFYFSLMKRVLPELQEISKETSAPGWDGYDAAPITEQTIVQSEAFLQTLPNTFPVPSVGAEPDGHVTFEWHRSSRRTLSVSVSPTGELHYAALLGPNKAFGKEIFYGEMPKGILDLIQRVYAA